MSTCRSCSRKGFIDCCCPSCIRNVHVKWTFTHQGKPCVGAQPNDLVLCVRICWSQGVGKRRITREESGLKWGRCDGAQWVDIWERIIATYRRFLPDAPQNEADRTVCRSFGVGPHGLLQRCQHLSRVGKRSTCIQKRFSSSSASKRQNMIFFETPLCRVMWLALARLWPAQYQCPQILQPIIFSNPPISPIVVYRERVGAWELRRLKGCVFASTALPGYHE